MEHEQLWAPWRLAYIKGDKLEPRERPRRFLPGADADCFLCRAIAEDADRENLVVHRTARSVVVLNRFPYNNGHLLVAPLLHKGKPAELTADEQADLQNLIVQFTDIIERLMNAEGFNVGLNLGRVAGAGLPGHLHWHVVPRWNGDTNFMPVLAGVDVIPQSLDALWVLFQEALAGDQGARG